MHGSSNGQSIIKKKKELKYEGIHAYYHWINGFSAEISITLNVCTSQVGMARIDYKK